MTRLDLINSGACLIHAENRSNCLLGIELIRVALHYQRTDQGLQSCLRAQGRRHLTLATSSKVSEQPVLAPTHYPSLLASLTSQVSISSPPISFSSEPSHWDIAKPTRSPHKVKRSTLKYQPGEAAYHTVYESEEVGILLALELI